MTSFDDRNVPPEKLREFHRAMRWEWFTIFYMSIAAVLIYLTQGTSQTMRTAFIEDMLSLVPPLGFIIVQKVVVKRTNREFPYGYHRAVQLGFLLAAAALLTMGVWLVIENTTTLLKAEHPHIGTVTVGGRVIWMGWLMLGAIFYSTAGPVIFGIFKVKMARSLHDKVLYTDAELNRADWLSGIAAISGVILVGLGFWWADAAAALIISIDILHDGYTSMTAVFADLMDRVPTTVDHKREDPVPKRIEEALRNMGWVQDLRLRMREHGNFLIGEVFVLVNDATDLPGKFARARELAQSIDWRVQELVFVSVHDLSEYPSNSAPVDHNHNAQRKK